VAASGNQKEAVAVASYDLTMLCILPWSRCTRWSEDRTATRKLQSGIWPHSLQSPSL